MVLLKFKKGYKFLFYKRKGRKFLLKKKFINPFVLKFKNVIFNKTRKKKNLMYGIFLKNSNLGLYSIYHFTNSYNIWYNKLIIQKKMKLNVPNSKYLLNNFSSIKNRIFSSPSLTAILKSAFLIEDKRKIDEKEVYKKRLSFIERMFKRKLRNKRLYFLIKNIKKKKRNSFQKIRYTIRKVIKNRKMNDIKNKRRGKSIKKIIRTKIYCGFNSIYINFHKIFLNIISKIRNQLSFYYDSFYNHLDLNKFPIRNDHVYLRTKNSIKNRFLTHVNVIFAFVKGKFLIVNLIDPALGLNMYSSHPSTSRRRISRFFSLSQKEQMSKYVFLFKLKKKKALKNKFLRTLTILGASRRLFSIQRTNPRVLNFILNIPRHIIDKTLYYSLTFFMKPFPSLNTPIEDVRQRMDYDPSRDKRLINKYKFNSNTYFKHGKYRYMKNRSFHNRRMNQYRYKPRFSLTLKTKKINSSSLILKFLIKYLVFLNCKNFGDLFFNKKRNIYFFFFIFAFVLKRIRLFIVLMLRNTSYIIRSLKIYKKKLKILKYLLKFFMISYKLQLPYQKDILRLLKYKSKKKRIYMLKKLSVYKKLGKLEILKEYFIKNILKTHQRKVDKSDMSLQTQVHNIIFTSCQSHGSFLKISKNRRI